MKKRRLIRNISLVALSAVLVGGAAMAFTGCKKDDPNELHVFIFCNDADAETNKRICETWADQYGDQIGRDIKINFEYNPSQEDYTQALRGRFTSNANIPDIMYLSPKNVVSWANPTVGRVLDLAPYLLNTQSSIDGTLSIWENSLLLYSAYADGNLLKNASSLNYNASGEEGKGFYDDEGHKLGIYGMPKDYSNFSMGYNRLFFTDEMKELYESHKASEKRNVSSHIYLSSGEQKVQHTGDVGDEPFIINAVTGEEANIINIGVPTTYKPFNFYRYENYDNALAAGDPIAAAVEYYSVGEGYTVTIPGYPDEEFSVTDTKYQDPDAIYDKTTGHIVYTYAEYGALTWALTYFLNTFAWDNDQNLTSGEGGTYYADAERYQNVYGGEQYENALGPNLYVLPWLFSNDAAYITTDSTKVRNNPNNTGTFGPDDTVESMVGTNTEPVEKRTLDGGWRTAQVQYGMDSAAFIETYGAFHEHGSAWNGNSGQAGDGEAADKGNLSGWDYFRGGAAIFYGAGTWDAATRNSVDIDTMDFGQMPAPVSEKFALYSEVRDAYYSDELAVYSNATTVKGVAGEVGTANGENGPTGDYAQRSKLSDGLRVYDEAEILANQLKRQDKWGARMDSVGFAAYAGLADETGESAWKAEGAANLIMALTIDESAQLTLTYGGAQLPNVKQQCIDFLNYQETGYEEGAFKDMLTPDGSATVTGEAGAQLWQDYYALARKMAAAAKSGSSETVASFLDKAENYVQGKKASYDPQYADTQLGNFLPGDASTYIAYAMRVLRMVNLRHADRDLNIRMQYGLNAARDQLTYTTGTQWITVLDQSGARGMLTYSNQAALGKGVQIQNIIRTELSQKATDYKYSSPAILCLTKVAEAQQDLDNGV